MGNGTIKIENSVIKAAYENVVKLPYINKHEHWPLPSGAFVAVIKNKEHLDIMFYDFKRSIKPLARVIEGGEVIIIRDFFPVDQLQTLFTELEVEARTWVRLNDTLRGKNLNVFPPSSLSGGICHPLYKDVEIEGVILRGRPPILKELTIDLEINRNIDWPEIVEEGALSKLFRNHKLCDPHRSK